MSWDEPIVERVADGALGYRGPEHVEVAPHGNAVLSYLDVVARDNTPVGDVESALREFNKWFDAAELPVSRRLGRIAIRFGALFGLYDLAHQEFEALSSQVLDLLRNQPAPPWRRTEPLTVDVTQDEEGLTFEIPEESKLRLRAIHGKDWVAPRIRITHETRGELEIQHGDIYLNLVQVFTNLSLERCAELGGIRYRDASSRRVLWVWPQRSNVQVQQALDAAVTGLRREGQDHLHLALQQDEVAFRDLLTWITKEVPSVVSFPGWVQYLNDAKEDWREARKLLVRALQRARPALSFIAED
jgi:hypothetical protein